MDSGDDNIQEEEDMEQPSQGANEEATHPGTERRQTRTTTGSCQRKESDAAHGQSQAGRK